MKNTIVAKVCALSATAVLISSISSCGKKKEDEEESSKAMPGIGLTLPESSDSGVSLTTAAETSIITKWQQRANSITDHINKELETLNAIIEKLDGATSFKDKGPNANISGVFAEETGDYNYSATICVGGKVYTNTRWSADGARVYSSRDLNNAPVALKQRDLKVEVTYVAGVDKTLEVYSYGASFGTPPESDKPFLAEHIIAKQLTTSGDFTLTGVNSWTAEAVTSFTGDGYLVGQVTSDGQTGEYVGAASRFKTIGACTADFSEATQNWCVGRSLKGTTRYTEAERADAWTRLKATTSLVSSSTLKVVAVTGTCP